MDENHVTRLEHLADSARRKMCHAGFELLDAEAAVIRKREQLKAAADDLASVVKELRAAELAVR